MPISKLRNCTIAFTVNSKLYSIEIIKGKVYYNGNLCFLEYTFYHPRIIKRSSRKLDNSYHLTIQRMFELLFMRNIIKFNDNKSKIEELSKTVWPINEASFIFNDKLSDYDTKIPLLP